MIKKRDRKILEVLDGCGRLMDVQISSFCIKTHTHIIIPGVTKYNDDTIKSYFFRNYEKVIERKQVITVY